MTWEEMTVLLKHETVSKQPIWRVVNASCATQDPTSYTDPLIPHTQHAMYL
jgi:hypothetical protein